MKRNARAASGHAAAAPPSVAKNFRRSMWLAIVTLRSGSFMQWRHETTLYGCALDEHTGREGAPPCLSLRHATGEQKTR
jgi:hypothetical protein